MELFWRPGLRVLWRGPGEVQCGTDPPLIVFGVTREEHDLLDAMAAADSQLDCWMTARLRGWSREKFAMFVQRLPPELFVDHPTAVVTATSRYWSLLGISGQWSTMRGDHGVVVDGVDSFGLRIAYALAEAGVGAVWLRDTSAITVEDVEPSGYREIDIGLVRQTAALAALRPRFPQTFLLAGDPPIGFDFASGLDGAAGPRRARLPTPTTVVVVAYGACDLRRVREYTDEGFAYLPVVVRDADVMVGPLARPVGGPCLHCVHLTYTDADPRWPAVATQLASLPKANLDPVVASAAAALTAHQVTAFVDGRPTAVVDMSLHVDGVHPIPRYKQWLPHPRCGCEIRNFEQSHTAAQTR